MAVRRTGASRGTERRTDEDQPHAVDAPIASLFHSLRCGRRATNVLRSAATTV